VAKNHWAYEGRPRYNPEKEGYGNPRKWRAAFAGRMSLNDATAHFRSKKETPREVLGVASYATWADIKHAYRVLCLEWHPDRVKTTGKDEKAAEARFKDISAAYAILANEYGE
jgi:DnaJ-domain-containing protein 1